MPAISKKPSAAPAVIKAIAKKPSVAASPTLSKKPSAAPAVIKAIAKKTIANKPSSAPTAAKNIAKKPSTALTKKPASSGNVTRRVAHDDERVQAERAFAEALAAPSLLNDEELGFLPFSYIEEGPWVWDFMENDFNDQLEFVHFCGASETFNWEAMPTLPSGPPPGSRPVFHLKVGIYDDQDSRVDAISIGTILEVPVFDHWMTATTFSRLKQGHLRNMDCYTLTKPAV